VSTIAVRRRFGGRCNSAFPALGGRSDALVQQCQSARLARTSQRLSLQQLANTILKPFLKGLIGSSTRVIAQELTNRRIATRSGDKNWKAMTVLRVMGGLA
jgi:hypothetical protein